MGRIARLEIENFKSYGGIHVIGPFKRFTAVIGPNGAGKSNLMDAISFVLGVPSRQLRSTQLKDLIHNPPPATTAAAADSSDSTRLRARVTLVYELDENEVPGARAQQELLFTRTISDKGAGVYRIGRTDVSADAYQQQLKAIGILVKARNFLVFQGDVESVASKTPEELTKLFEQIAASDELRDEYDRLLEAKNAAEEHAIFAYQKKKGLVAEKRMVHAQKEEAQAFRTKRRALHELRVKQYLWQLFAVHNDTQRHRKALTAAQQALSTAAADDADGVAYRTQKKAHSLALRDLSHKRAAVEDVERELAAVQPRTIRLREQTKYAQRKRVEADDAAAALQQRQSRQVREIAALEMDLQELAAAKRELETQQQSFAQDTSNQSLLTDSARLDEYYRIKEAVAIQTNQLQSELDAVRRLYKTDVNKVQTLTQERDENNKLCAMLTEDLARANERSQSMRDVIVETERAIADTEATIRQAETDRTGQSERKEQLNDELARITSTLRDLKDDKQQSQADSRRTEMLETLQRLFPGVRGRLVDLCKPVQRKYNMAVTVATGKYMDAIVVTDAKTAQDCIAYLREARLGVAQFLPLEALRNKAVNERFRHLGERVKLVIDVIECDDEIEPALLYAVGDTVVCDTIDVARELRFGRNERLKAVTLSGMVISKSGSMTGGRTSSDATRANRWDDKAIDAFEAQQQALVDELQALDAHGGNYARMQTLQTQLEGFQNRLRYARADVVTTDAKKPTLQQRIDDAKRRIVERLEPELQTFEAAVATRAAAIETLEAQIYQVEDELFATFSQQVGVASIRVYEQTVLARKQQFIDTRRRISEHMTKLTAQIQYLEAQDVDAPLADAIERAAHEKQRLVELAQQAKTLQQTVATLTTQRDAAQDDVRMQTAHVDALEQALRTLGQQRASSDATRSDVLQTIADEQATLQQLDDKRRAILQRASLDQVTLPFVAAAAAEEEEEAANAATPSASAIDFSVLGDAVDDDPVDARDVARRHAAYDERIHVLLADLERMQPNVRALDQFDAIQDRIAGEETEVDRIRQRSIDAAAAFEHVRAARCERFTAAFTHIAGVIDATYKQLTKSAKHPLGGTAYLSLENTEEPYLGGVKYNAMPPMKRFREMEQLSGGEKTVAALALLFAVHNFRPSPFFVLDEVDAALDNVNVNKVAAYIAQCDFQCVVISLKDAFYERADALVGVCKDIRLQRSQTLMLDLTRFDSTDGTVLVDSGGSTTNK